MTAATSLAGALPGCVSDKLSHCYDNSSFITTVALSLQSGSRTASRTPSGFLVSPGSTVSGTMAVHRRTSHSRSGGHGVDVCAVCMDQTPVVAVVGCGHELCFDCARCIVGGGVGCRPPLCPFCRITITGFRLAVPL